MSRLGLILHGLRSGVLFGIFAGIADAWTTNHTYLDRTFLWVSVLAWVVAWAGAGLGLGVVASLLVDPQGRGPRSAASLAGAVSAVAALLPAWFLALVHINVAYLPSDTSLQAILFDLISVVLTIGLVIAVARALAGSIRRGGPAQAALMSWVGFALLAFAALAGATLAWRGGAAATGPPDRRAAADAPNVMLVVIDTLRRDHLSIEGYGRPTSPALDELARAGTRFTDFTSQSCYTKPAIASLLTSRYPSGHRVGHLRTVLSQASVTLAEAFHDAGWRTAKFVSNPIIGPEFGFAQGTELFHMLPADRIPQTKLGYALFRMTQSGRDVPLASSLAGTLRALEHAVTGRRGAQILHLTAPEVLDAFDRWRTTLGDDPWFAYLHFMEPHAPYDPPVEMARQFESPAEPMRADHPPNAGMFLPFSQGDSLPEADRAGMIRAYDAEIAGLDRLLGAFLERLARDASGRPTLIAITSDHGEEFYEHRGWGHGHSLHEELLAVPFLLVGPGVPAGLSVDFPAQLVDVAPTLLTLAHADVPTDMVGMSLVPVLERASTGSPPVFEDRERFAEIIYGDTYWARALQAGRWKVIVARRGEEERTQLYDLVADPGESRDLAAKLPDRVQAMTARIDSLVAEASSGSAPEVRGEFDPVTLERLRALGYVEP